MVVVTPTIRELRALRNPVKLSPRQQQIVNLLLQGYDNREIAKELGMAYRTVKVHFNRLFLRFGIHGGIKRVQLAVLLYRGQQECSAAIDQGSQEH